MRNSLRRLFENEPGIKVVGEAASGKEVMAFLKESKQAHPAVDVILLDMNMPEMDGLETTRAIMATCPTPILLLTAAEKTDPRVIQALALGALDSIQKPGGDERSPHIKERKTEILEKIACAATSNRRALAVTPSRQEGGHRVPSHDRRAATGGRPNKYDLILIGASTGGPAALSEILSALPHDFGIPVLIVQHIMEGYSSSLAEILQTKCALPVGEAATLTALEPGRVTIGKTGYHLEVTASKNIRLTRRNLDGFFIPSVDVLFESAAGNFNGTILGVILTGMGNDGLQGCRALKAKGHTVIIQDKRSSVVWGMPGEVHKDGCYDSVLALTEIAEMLRQTQGGT